MCYTLMEPVQQMFENSWNLQYLQGWNLQFYLQLVLQNLKHILRSIMPLISCWMMVKFSWVPVVAQDLFFQVFCALSVCWGFIQCVDRSANTTRHQRIYIELCLFLVQHTLSLAILAVCRVSENLFCCNIQYGATVSAQTVCYFY